MRLQSNRLQKKMPKMLQVKVKKLHRQQKKLLLHNQVEKEVLEEERVNQVALVESHNLLNPKTNLSDSTAEKQRYLPLTNKLLHTK